MVSPGQLRSGYTTGSCATAAVYAALVWVLEGTQQSTVTIRLPDGTPVGFSPEACSREGRSARCCIRKDAGDDPDVTNGMLVCAEVELDMSLPDGTVVFLRGEGVGVVTLPGLGIEVGGPAINPVPREMISSAARELLESHKVQGGVRVTVSVPGGEEVARKTLNARVGVIGGISIIGTSGRVIPYSEEAFVQSIARMISVAAGSGAKELVVTAGIRSENALRPFFAGLPDTAFIHYGNRIGSALELISREGCFERVTVGVMLAKATKLARGEFDLSSRTVGLDRSFIASLLGDAGYGDDVQRAARQLELVRSLVGILPFSADEPFYRLLAQQCRMVCRRRWSRGGLIFVLLTMEDGGVLCDENGCRPLGC